jgi:hypothetical protein
MGFEIEHDATQAPNGAITTDRRLFIAEDQKTLVEEGDVRARTQLAAPGHLIAAKDVERLGASSRSIPSPTSRASSIRTAMNS